jgi:hypothetical protein
MEFGSGLRIRQRFIVCVALSYDDSLQSKWIRYEAVGVLFNDKLKLRHMPIVSEP